MSLAPLCTFERDLKAGLKRCQLSGGPVLVGVSGGADSVALLRGVACLAREFSLRIRVAHFNHGWRDEAVADALWVESLAAQLGFPFHLGCADGPPPETAREETARNLRYEFLQQTALSTDCHAVLVAHTADDQAETVLHNILRGCGLKGLGGMAFVRPLTPSLVLARPMLAIRRIDVEAWLKMLSQAYRTDATNSNCDYLRNRLRHEVLPQLSSAIDRDVSANLCRLAEQSQECFAAIQPVVQKELQHALLLATPTQVRLRRSVVRALKEFLQVELLRSLWTTQNWPQSELTAAHWHRVIEAIEKGSRVQIPPRFDVTCDADIIRITKE